LSLQSVIRKKGIVMVKKITTISIAVILAAVGFQLTFLPFIFALQMPVISKGPEIFSALIVIIGLVISITVGVIIFRKSYKFFRGVLSDIQA